MPEGGLTAETVGKDGEAPAPLILPELAIMQEKPES